MRNLDSNHFVPIPQALKKKYELYKAHGYISSHAMNDALRKTFADMLDIAWKEHLDSRLVTEKKKQLDKRVSAKATDPLIIYSNDRDNGGSKNPKGDLI